MIKKYFFLTTLLLVQVILASNALSKDLTNSTILENIEQSLLFDKDDMKEINFYRKNVNSSDKIAIDRVADSAAGSELDIIVVDVSRDNNTIREKLKLAYNATLIDQNEVAIEIYKGLLKTNPDSHYMQFSLATIYQKMNQSMKAKKIYHKILEDNPDNKHEVISNLLSILIEESPQEAIYFLSRLAKQNPDSSYITAQLALAYEKTQKYDLALQYLRRSLAKDPDNIEYIYNIAVIYDKMNNSSNAIANYSAVVKNYSSKYDSISLNSVKGRIASLKAQKNDNN